MEMIIDGNDKDADNHDNCKNNMNYYNPYDKDN